MARTVRDAAILLGALGGRRPERDAATAESRGHAVPDYTRCPRRGRPARRAHRRHRKAFGFNRDVDRIMEEALGGAEARRAPCSWIPPTSRTPGSTTTTEMEVLLYELKADLNAYLAALGPNGARQDARRRHRLQRGPRRRGDALLRPGAVLEGAGEGPAHRHAPTSTLSRRTAGCRGPKGIDAVMDAAPARRHRRAHGRAGLAHRPASTATTSAAGSSTPAAVAGYPNINVPAGYVVRPARGDLVLGPRVERADPDPAGLRVRAGDACPPAAAIPGGDVLRKRPATPSAPQQGSPPPRYQRARMKAAGFPWMEYDESRNGGSAVPSHSQGKAPTIYGRFEMARSAAS